MQKERSWEKQTPVGWACLVCIFCKASHKKQTPLSRPFQSQKQYLRLTAFCSENLQFPVFAVKPKSKSSAYSLKWMEPENPGGFSVCCPAHIECYMFVHLSPSHLILIMYKWHYGQCSNNLSLIQIYRTETF